MAVTVRRVTQSATRVGGDVIQNLMTSKATYGLQQRVSTASIVTPTAPPGLTYDDTIELVMGVTINGVPSNVTTRFKGIVREQRYSYSPRGVETVMYGFLQRAVEYENTEESTLVDSLGRSILGGLVPYDLTGAVDGHDTAGNIIHAVLDRANVPHNAADIDSSSVLFGFFDDAFVWVNGTNENNPDLLAAGETAIAYIERYDEVDGDHTGRYKTFETLPVPGGVFRVQIQYPPSGAPDFTFTETVDILDGQMTRSITATRNYFVVTGYDVGAGVGPVNFVLQQANTFQGPTTKHTQMLNSPMIARSLDSDGGTGQSCETLCYALAAEFNREIVTGWIKTHRDDIIGIAQKHLVAGNGGQADRLGTGQLLLVTGLEISVDNQGFRQRITYVG